MMMPNRPEPIAIVGIGLRFPKAKDPPAFWQLLKEGRTGVDRVPKGRWSESDFYDPKPGVRGKIVTNQGGFLDNIDQFDWRAFRISPREASRIDPQHRLLLEVTWEAFEDAGLNFATLAGSKAGVFIGLTWNDFLRAQSQAVEHLDGYTATGNLFSFASNRISHFFDLRGPSMSIDGACASSLMSTQLACESLWSRQTDLALAGGVELMVSADSSVIMSQAGVLSASGQCRTLDEKADGFVRGEGAGVIVLKRLSDVENSDLVYALICGTAVNHNGRNQWIMAPNGQAQEAVIREAYHRSGKKPSQVDYVELHGTAFKEGDVIETLAVGHSVGQAKGRKKACLIGAHKQNIGSLGAAAGVASLIKVALALHHEEIPPNINLEQINAKIHLDELHLSPPRTLTPWPKRKGRAPIAGVHATSLSGSNAHVVLEGYRPRKRTSAAAPSSDSPIKTCPFLLSARSEVALKNMVQAMIAFIDHLPVRDSLTFQNVCYALAVHRTHHEHRLAICGDNFDAIKQRLSAFLESESAANVFVGTKTQEKEETKLLAAEKMGRLFSQGYRLSWAAWFGKGRRFIRLPLYQWDKERCWPDWLHAINGNKSVDESPSTNRPEAARLPFSTKFSNGPDLEQSAKLKDVLRQHIIRLLDLPTAETLDWDQSFQELGVDSFLAVELTQFINRLLDISLSATLLFNYTNLDRLVTYLVEETGHKSKHLPNTQTDERIDLVESKDLDTLRILLDEKMASLEQRLGAL
ncbi:MAG: polyketide synthase [Anaerolineae bacterium]|nr:polyketide synthase [Anaerolineae bacterium]